VVRLALPNHAQTFALCAVTIPMVVIAANALQAMTAPRHFLVMHGISLLIFFKQHFN